MNCLSIRNLSRVVNGGWPKMCAGLWLAFAAFGLVAIWSFKAEAGLRQAAPARWPIEAGLQFSAERPNLLLFLHPKCPCARASVEELAAILTDSPDRALIQVLLYVPPGEPDAWARTDVWTSLETFRGVTVRADRNAAQARLFGAATSGAAILYDFDGVLRFSGGITGARGHAGVNPGRLAVIDLLEKGRTRVRQTPVFGCPIFEPEAGP